MRVLGPDPIDHALQLVLAALESGKAPREIESRIVDCKEEPGRRRGRDILPGAARSEPAAAHLANEAACFANTPGGGALVVGFADDGTAIGTELDAEWLRHRIWELTDRKLTIAVRADIVRGVRVLILPIPKAIEPIPFQNRYRWRVADNCVPVDATTLLSGQLQQFQFDWMAQPSRHDATGARPAALDAARSYLRASGEPAGIALAGVPDADLLSRINAITGEGKLTNAAALLFVGQNTSHVFDYIRRDVSGGDSTFRFPPRDTARVSSVLEDLWMIEQAITIRNSVAHLHGTGFSEGQVRNLPEKAIREAIVNGVAHRDWDSRAPVTIEHVGNTLTVTSPGGFVGGVTPDNIITHPSAPRHRALADLLARLRVAEYEGIGVDRMVREMLRLGHPAPVIHEIGGPMVRAVLLGGAPDQPWLTFLGSLEPARTAEDLNALILIDRLVREGWIDAERAALALQRTVVEGERALIQFAEVTVRSAPLIVHVATTNDHPAYRLSDLVRRGVAGSMAEKVRGWLPPAARSRLAQTWARARGRVSTTEIADIVGANVADASAVLKMLESDGRLASGRRNRSGRGFFYVPVPAPDTGR